MFHLLTSFIIVCCFTLICVCTCRHICVNLYVFIYIDLHVHKYVFTSRHIIMIEGFGLFTDIVSLLRLFFLLKIGVLQSGRGSSGCADG